MDFRISLIEPPVLSISSNLNITIIGGTVQDTRLATINNETLALDLEVKLLTTGSIEYVPTSLGGINAFEVNNNVLTIRAYKDINSAQEMLSL